MNIARYAFTTYTQNRHKKWPGQTTATATATTGTATAINRPSETTDVLPIAGALLSTMLYATLVEGAGGLMTKQRPPSGRDAPSILDTSVITTFPFVGDDDRLLLHQVERTRVVESVRAANPQLPDQTTMIINAWSQSPDTDWQSALLAINRSPANQVIECMRNLPDFMRTVNIRLSLDNNSEPSDAILIYIISKMCAV